VNKLKIKSNFCLRAIFSASDFERICEVDFPSASGAETKRISSNGIASFFKITFFTLAND
jgi:hypothetical protein